MPLKRPDGKRLRQVWQTRAPRGPRYGLRRLVVALIALVLVLCLVGGIIYAGVWARNKIKGQDAERAAQAAGTTFAMPTDCALPALDVSADAPLETRVGAGATFTLVMRNKSKNACVLDVGSQNLALVVGSAAATLFNSSACPTGATSKPLLIDAGDSATVSLHWDGTIANTDCLAKTAQLEAPSGFGDGSDSSASADPTEAATANPADAASDTASDAATSAAGEPMSSLLSAGDAAASGIAVQLPHLAGGAAGSAGLVFTQGSAAPTSSPTAASNPPISMSVGGQGGYAQAGTYWIRLQLGGKDLLDARPMVIS